MADPREWISRVKAETPPDLWSEVQERTDSAPSGRVTSPALGGWPGRPAGPRHAALMTGVAAGILALMLVAVGLRSGPPGDEPPTPTPEPTPLVGVHRQLERALSDLWIAETNRFLLRSELEAAQDELTRIVEDAGATPTDAERRRIEAAQQAVDANARSLHAARAEVEHLRPGVEQLRELRAGLLPPPDAQVYPEVATVRCTGDGEGGTHLSTPVVRARADGARVRVVNLFPNERAYFVVDGVVVHELPPATTADVVLPGRPSGDVEILCTYDEPPEFSRPSHPLWIS